MEYTWIRYKGYEYPAIEVDSNLIDSEGVAETKYLICDVDFWNDALERDCMNGDPIANAIDETIYFYCESGFVAGKPSVEEVVEYFKKMDL